MSATRSASARVATSSAPRKTTLGRRPLGTRGKDVGLVLSKPAASARARSALAEKQRYSNSRKAICW